MKTNRQTSTFVTIAWIVMFLMGISFLMYPTIANQWNKNHQTTAIALYEDTVETVNNSDIEERLEAARAYNKGLAAAADRNEYVAEHQTEYESLLDMGSGVMGYVEIPQIQTSLSLYHGTDEDTLQVALGHVEWSSLPVGGEGTHCVISGHTGLPSAKLFTDLDTLKKGDIFSLHVLGEVLYYEVDQIQVKLPEDTKSLVASTDGDYCTLVTCTPYGVNSHRLLVRGHRIDYESVYQGTTVSEGNIAATQTVSVLFGILTALLLAVQYGIRMRLKQ